LDLHLKKTYAVLPVVTDSLCADLLMAGIREKLEDVDTVGQSQK
jgi:hypothetical protein